MRFHNWDVLLFPSNGEPPVPLKEFRVACQVVLENEISHAHGPISLPTMTCFVPSLPASTCFYVSIYCWGDPNMSHSTRAYSKKPETSKFEAQVFIDGRLVAVNHFFHDSERPAKIRHTFELTKTGEPEPLRFPAFHRELLYQNHWNPADNLGRVKVVINGGLPRDSLSSPMDRVETLVAFSFQHAPLDILENNGIAWPNPSMWRQHQPSPILGNFPGPGAGQHTHSPRHRSLFSKSNTMRGLPNPQAFGLAPSQDGTFGQTSDIDCADFVATGGKTYWPESPRDWRNDASAGIASPDPTTTQWHPDLPGDPMHISGSSLDDDPVPTTADLKVPTNTPTSGNRTAGSSQDTLTSFQVGPSSSLPNLALSLSQSLANQAPPIAMAPQGVSHPALEIRSKKESRILSFSSSAPSLTMPTPRASQVETRKFAQPLFNTSFVSPGLTMLAPAVHGNTGTGSSPSGIASTPSESRDAFIVRPGVNVGLPSGSIRMPLGESSSSTINLTNTEPAQSFTSPPVKTSGFERGPSQASPHGGDNRLITEVTDMD